MISLIQYYQKLFFSFTKHSFHEGEVGWENINEKIFIIEKIRGRRRIKKKIIIKKREYIFGYDWVINLRI